MLKATQDKNKSKLLGSSKEKSGGIFSDIVENLITDAITNAIMNNCTIF